MEVTEDKSIISNSLKSKVKDFLATELKHPPLDSLSSITPAARLTLLNSAIRSFTYRVPFQNILLMSEAANDRRLPNLEEIVDDITSGKGGLCFTNNTFFQIALECLGFDAFCVAASVSSANSHIIIGVRNVVTDGDLYVVEVGCGYPSFSAIPLDFATESPTFKDSYLTYKLVRRSADDPHDAYDASLPVYERWQKWDGVRPVPPQDLRGENKDWYRFYHFTMEPRSLTFFEPFIGPLYEATTGVGPFHKILTVSQFPGGRGITCRTTTTASTEDEAKEIRKMTLIREMENGAAEKETFLMDDETELDRCKQRIGGFFPLLKDHMVAAFLNYMNL